MRRAAAMRCVLSREERGNVDFQYRRRFEGDFSMLFELRTGVPEVSSDWTEARDLYLAGKVRAAWDVATSKRNSRSLQTANDYILNVEIARACAANRTYLALARLAESAFPDDPIVQLYHSRALLTRARHTEGIKYLHSLEPTLGQTHRALWGTELANLYGDAGFEASCRKWGDEMRDVPGVDSPLALYTQSCASEGLQRWDEAIEYARQCVAVAPDWTRARGYLANCLLARGKVEEAEGELAEAKARGHEEAIVELSSAMLTMALGRFEQAREQMETLLAKWPQADFVKYLRRTLVVLLVELRDYEEARRIADGEEEMLSLPTIPSEATGQHKFIPLPLVAQNKNQCVPTTVAMAAYPQGRRFDPDMMFRQMHGREGTPMWRMRQWVEENGFRLVPIRLEKEGIVELLEHNIPLIGMLEGPFNAHVDVVCGYNDDLETLYVRDPAHWAPAAWPWKIALLRYELHDGLLAVIESDRHEVLEIAEKWRSADLGSLLDLSQAVAEGNVTAAEAAYASISDDSKTACVRDGFAVNVAMSPVQFQDRMRVVAEDEEANVVARFRAIMSLGSDDLEGVLAKLMDEDDSDLFGSRIRRYLRLQRIMSKGDWRLARGLIDQLLVTGGGIAAYWELQSDILAELGDQPASFEALERAIELEPLRMSLREKSLNRSANRLTLAEYLAEFDALLADDPDEKRLLWGRAKALYDGPDGNAYEQAVKEVIRWYPRDPNCYSFLIRWYHTQERADMADALLETAVKMLPDCFRSTEEIQNEADEKKEPSTELPDEKTDLLDLVWEPDDPRRSDALERVLEMQQAGNLHWYEVARLLACRLLIGDDPQGDKVDAEALLPESPPGAAHWFAGALCELLTEYDPGIDLSHAVNLWLERVVPDVNNYPDLWFERVLLFEQEKQMERALEELRQLLDRYPAMSSALYRMGVVKYGQEDFPSARQYFEKALEVNPGLYGAMRGLRNVHEVEGAHEKIHECSLMLRRKMPYSVEFLRDVVLETAEQQSINAAEKLLVDVAAHFPARRLGVIHARALMLLGQYSQASDLLAKHVVSSEDKDEDLFEDYLQVRMEVAMQSNDRHTILELCDEGISRWPDSTRLKEIQAEHLFDEDPERSRTLLREVLCEGEPQAQTAYQYLCINGHAADSEAREVIGAAAKDRQEHLAVLFSEVMGAHELLRWNEPYLVWAIKEFPEADTLRWRLMNHYSVNAQADKAVPMAEELCKRNPNSPEATRTLGRCLTDLDPERALPHLEKACEQNRSAEYLFDLGRCYQALGNKAKCDDINWEILEQNPYVSCAWTGLFIAGASRERLWPYLLPMLERGYGSDDEYFLVAAVEIAISQGKKLPQRWIQLALERWQILETHPGWRDERDKLLQSLLAWRTKRRADINGTAQLPRSFFQTQKARFWWPKCAWIPT